jgi:hypothetical protein
MEHRAARLEHTGEFRERAGQVFHVFENIRRENNIEAGVRKRQRVSTIRPDIEHPALEVGRGF